MKRLIVLVTFVIVGAGHAQPPDTLWTYNFPDREVLAIKATSDGGIVALKNSYSSGLVLKFDALGNIVWTHDFSGQSRYIQTTRDGGFIVLASDNGTKLVRMDSSGSTEWERNYPYGSIAQLMDFVSETQDGGFVVTGAPLSGRCMWRFNANGDTLWHRNLWNPQCLVYNVIPSANEADGRIRLLDLLNQWESPWGNYFQVQTWTYAGDSVTSRTYSDTTRELEELDAEVTNTGNMVVAGLGEGFFPEGCAVFVARFNPQGDAVWSRGFYDNSPADGCGALSVDVTSDGGCVAGGIGTDGEGGNWGLIVKIDSTGYQQWYLSSPLLTDGSITDIVQTSDGGYAAVLSFTDNDGHYIRSRLFRFAPDTWASPNSARLTCTYIPETDRLRLNWSERQGAIEYRIYSGLVPGEAETLEGTLPAGTHSFELTPQSNWRFYLVTAEYSARQ